MRITSIPDQDIHVLNKVSVFANAILHRSDLNLLCRWFLTDVGLVLNKVIYMCMSVMLGVVGSDSLHIKKTSV